MAPGVPPAHQGLVTDRDIVVRAAADGKDLGITQLAEVCGAELVTVSPDDDIKTAGQRMREAAAKHGPRGSHMEQPAHGTARLG